MPRAQYGEDNGRTILTDEEVDLIRKLRAEPVTPGTKRFWTIPMLAAKFEVSRATIEKIIYGKRRV